MHPRFFTGRASDSMATRAVVKASQTSFGEEAVRRRSVDPESQLLREEIKKMLDIGRVWGCQVRWPRCGERAVQML